MAGRPLTMVIASGLFVTLLCALFGYLTWRQIAPMTEWATVKGRIEAAQIVRRDLPSTTQGPGGRLHPNWVAEVRYRYSVGDRVFDGTRLANRQITSGWTDGAPPPAWLSERIAPYPTGGQAIVRYDPDDPATSVLEIDRTPLLWLIGGAVAGLIVAGSGLLAPRLF